MPYQRPRPHEISPVLHAETPLVISPTLMQLFGAEPAIFIQQLHYWVQKSHNLDDQGVRWVYNSYEDWLRQIPMSARTIRRVVKQLRDELGIIRTEKREQKRLQHRLHYTIHYPNLNAIVDMWETAWENRKTSPWEATADERSRVAEKIMREWRLDVAKMAAPEVTIWPDRSGQNGHMGADAENHDSRSGQNGHIDSDSLATSIVTVWPHDLHETTKHETTLQRETPHGESLDHGEESQYGEDSFGAKKQKNSQTRSSPGSSEPTSFAPADFSHTEHEGVATTSHSLESEKLNSRAPRNESSTHPEELALDGGTKHKTTPTTNTPGAPTPPVAPPPPSPNGATRPPGPSEEPQVTQNGLLTVDDMGGTKTGPQNASHEVTQKKGRRKSSSKSPASKMYQNIPEHRHALVRQVYELFPSLIGVSIPETKHYAQASTQANRSVRLAEQKGWTDQQLIEILYGTRNHIMAQPNRISVTMSYIVDTCETWYERHGQRHKKGNTVCGIPLGSFQVQTYLDDGSYAWVYDSGIQHIHKYPDGSSPPKDEPVYRLPDGRQVQIRQGKEVFIDNEGNALE